MSTLVLSDVGLSQRPEEGKVWGAEVAVEDLRSRIAGGARVQILDVREVAEFATGHLAGAVNIPLNEVVVRRGELKASRAVVVICKGGMRSAKAIAALREAGYRGSLSNVTGGMLAWTKAFGTDGVRL